MTDNPKARDALVCEIRDMMYLPLPDCAKLADFVLARERAATEKAWAEMIELRAEIQKAFAQPLAQEP